MKKHLMLLVVILLLTVNSKGQYPIIEEFNLVTTWTYTNGAGMQNYGGAENYATTNQGNIPYPNNATVTITSPIYNFTTSCASDITISFPISGRIENGWDWLYVEYFNAGAWVNLGGFTGPIAGTYTNTTIPNTTTQFRFRLVTDCSVNGYKGPTQCSLSGYPTSCAPPPGNCNGAISVYYYDITRFTIDCATVLPITLLEFNGYNIDKHDNYLYWTTTAEINNDYFTLERSRDAINFESIGTIGGAGNSNVETSYYFVDDSYINGVNYYRLKQTDFDGKFTYSKIISINNEIKEYDEPIYIINLLGQKVDENYTGIRIVVYKDGRTFLIPTGKKNPKIRK